MRTSVENSRTAGKPWVIVLAGGDGSRLSSITRKRYGYDRPKQFCDFGDGTLLGQTIDRARRLTEGGRIVVATTARHRPEADECLARETDVQRVEQPDNRGTTPGILLPLLSVLRQDPQARVVILPSDHGIEDEHSFARHLADADQCAALNPARAYLLGLRVDSVDDGYGWITSHAAPSRAWEAVDAFHEKPARSTAETLRDRGAYVNTFVIAARAAKLASLIQRHATSWYDALVGSARESLRETYARLAGSDFSRQVLTPSSTELGVVPVADVGWTDLGTPARLVAFSRRERRSPPASGVHGARPAPAELALVS